MHIPQLNNGGYFSSVPKNEKAAGLRLPAATYETSVVGISKDGNPVQPAVFRIADGSLSRFTRNDESMLGLAAIRAVGQS